jgi:epsilon-lactone hydrolase
MPGEHPNNGNSCAVQEGEPLEGVRRTLPACKHSRAKSTTFDRPGPSPVSPTLRLPETLLRATLRGLAPVFASPRIPIPKQRRIADALSAVQRPPRGTRVAPAEVGGVSGERVSPPGSASEGVLLFLHGGGYAIGSPRSYRGLAARLAAAIGVSAFVPDYRLAPEHPHPAALEDALAGYRGLLANGTEPGRIAVAGNSAGGGLALALAMALRDAGVRAPAVIGMLCPWLDLTVDVAGARPPAPREPLLTRAGIARWAAAYTKGCDPTDPGISPLLGDLSGLPPLVLEYAGDDLLAGDGERLVEGAKAAGAELEHRRYQGLWHDFYTHANVLAVADEAVAGCGAELRARLS